jgi:hypothetical protein
MPICELCQFDEVFNFHHLIPRTVHRNKWFRKRYTRAECQQGLRICLECHRTIHQFIPSEKELGRNYNTREKLVAHQGIARYLKWKRRRVDRE